MVSEDLEGFFGTMEVVRAPGPVGLTDAMFRIDNLQHTNCGENIKCQGMGIPGVKEQDHRGIWDIGRPGVFRCRRNTQVDKFRWPNSRHQDSGHSRYGCSCQ